MASPAASLQRLHNGIQAWNAAAFKWVAPRLWSRPVLLVGVAGNTDGH